MGAEEDIKSRLIREVSSLLKQQGRLIGSLQDPDAWTVDQLNRFTGELKQKKDVVVDGIYDVEISAASYDLLFKYGTIPGETKKEPRAKATGDERTSKDVTIDATYAVDLSERAYKLFIEDKSPNREAELSGDGKRAGPGIWSWLRRIVAGWRKRS